MTTVAAAIAANRFGLGARPGDLRRIAADPRGWLTQQLAAAETPPMLAELRPSHEIAVELQRFFESQRAARRGQASAAWKRPDGATPDHG